MGALLFVEGLPEMLSNIHLATLSSYTDTKAYCTARFSDEMLKVQKDVDEYRNGQRNKTCNSMLQSFKDSTMRKCKFKGLCYSRIRLFS